MGSVWHFYLGIYLGKIPIWFELFVYSASTFLVEFAMIVYAVDGAWIGEENAEWNEWVSEWGGDELYWNAQKVEQPRRPSPMMKHK